MMAGHFQNHRRGFTLVELLIVVGIIAILAAIAVPNFLEAQVRAKVARTQADQRSLATAIEAYAVDYQRYPAYNNPIDYALFAGEPIVFTPVNLTTPTAYLTSLPLDVFPGRRTGLPRGTPTPYFYMHDYQVVYLGRTQAAGHVRDHFRTLSGGSRRPVQWTVWSFGPDLRDDHGVVLYDPTNGTISRGDMMRFGP
jgi:prepilin-type N-terminal cleavage/methylation domain-containing protein